MRQCEECFNLWADMWGTVCPQCGSKKTKHIGYYGMGEAIEAAADNMPMEAYEAMQESSSVNPYAAKKKKEDHWDSDLEVVNSCPAQAKKVTILMSYEVDLKITSINKHMNTYEWLAYLIGSWDDDTAIATIHDIYIPEQEVTLGSVDVTEGVTLPGIIGTVHSHGSPSGIGEFSAVDDKYLMGNHPINILVGGKGYKAIGRRLAPCGRLMLLNADITIVHSKHEELLDEAKVKIKKPTYTRYTSFADVRKQKGQKQKIEEGEVGLWGVYP